MKSITDSALHFNRLGARVVPVIGRGCEGLVHLKPIYHAPQQTPHQVSSFDWDSATGVAICCGPGGWLCLDFDRAGMRPVWSVIQTLGLGTDYPWLVKTPGKGGGAHLWLRCYAKWNETAPMWKIKAGGGNLELRLGGGAIITVAPPSAHVDGGRYEWATEKPPTAAPQGVERADLQAAIRPIVIPRGHTQRTSNRAIGAARQASQDKSRRLAQSSDVCGWTRWIAGAFRGEIRNLQQTPEGGRNKQLYVSAKELTKKGAEESEIHEALAPIAAEIGLDDGEIGPTIHSGYIAGQEKRKSRMRA